MRTVIIASVVSLFAVSGAVAQLPAQKGMTGKGERPTAPPSGSRVDVEPPTTAAMQMERKVGGQEPVAAIVSKFRIGVRGYKGRQGVVVMDLVSDKDLDQSSKRRCPAAAIRVDIQGNGKVITMKLERGDVITAAGDYQVKTVDELAVAINTAADPHDMEITFIDWRTGNEYTGRINAMRIK
jgi:S1-C subfamily serine protease